MRKSSDSFVSGNFDGWDPDTIYVLDDGSTWKLAYPVYLDMRLYRPRATVYTEHKRHYMRVGFSERRVEVIRLTKATKNRELKMPKRPEDLAAWFAEMQRFDEALLGPMKRQHR